MRGSFGAAMLVAVAALALTVGTAVAAPGGAAGKPLWQASQNYYVNRVAPADSPATRDLKASDLKDTPARTPRPRRGISATRPPHARSRAARRWRTRPAESPRTIARTKQGMPAVQHARMLVIPVEFNPNANDDFSGFARYDADDPTGCVTEPAGTVFNGPTHNQIPNPATLGKRDNNTLWVPDFSPDYYSKLIFSTAGHHPEGAQGPQRRRDLKGLTVHNYYQEVSKGRYDLERRRHALDPRAALRGVVLGRHLRGRRQERPGPPGQPARRQPDHRRRASRRSPRPQPNFDWASYDVEDQQDVDDDGNLFEPNGVLDHVVVVHAGVDQSDGGGAQGTYALWANSNVVDPGNGGYAFGDTGYKVSNVTYQPENAETGVIAHEFGHDLGLPDLYDSHRRDRPGHGLLGHHEQRLALRPSSTASSRRTWAPGASTSSAGSNPTVLDYGSRNADRHARAGERAAEGHRGGGAREPSRQEGHARLDAQRRQRLVVEPTTRTTATSA